MLAVHVMFINLLCIMLQCTVHAMFINLCVFCCSVLYMLCLTFVYSVAVCCTCYVYKPLCILLPCAVHAMFINLCVFCCSVLYMLCL